MSLFLVNACIVDGMLLARMTLTHRIIRITVTQHYGIDKIAEMALERAWDGCDAVYMSYDIDSIEAGTSAGKTVFHHVACIRVLMISRSLQPLSLEQDGPSRVDYCRERL